MGRYLTLGVVTTIEINRRYGANIHVKKKKILKEVSKYLDVSKYNSKEDEDSIILKIDAEYFNDNIHNLIKSLYPVFSCCEILYNYREKIEKCGGVLSDKFNATNIPLILKQYETTVEHQHEKGEFYGSWNGGTEDGGTFETQEYWVFEDRELKDDFTIYFKYIDLWQDYNKIDSEDLMYLMKIMNSLKFPQERELSNNILFHIYG